MGDILGDAANMMDVGDVDAIDRERFDDAMFPLVKSVFPQHATLEMVASYFLSLRQKAERGPFVLMADVRPLDTRSVDAVIRAAFFKASAAFDRDVGPAHYLGEAVIVSSALQRALLSAYTWFIGDTAYPTRVFRNEVDAEKWCIGRLYEAGALTTPNIPSPAISPVARGPDG